MSQQETLSVKTNGKGLYNITSEVEALALNWPQTGVLHIFIKHTSCSLLIQENADPSARHDLETFFEKLAPEHQAWHTHTLEGPDDTTSHLKSALTHTFLTVPITDGQLNLGTWQGIYLFEHRHHPHQRKIIATVLGS